MTEAAVETYDTTTRGAASMAAYRAVRILQLLSENTGEDKAMLSDELIRRLAHPDDPARMPISAARRSIYTAISALRHAGYEIEYKRGVGYKLLTSIHPNPFRAQAARLPRQHARPSSASTRASSSSRPSTTEPR